MKICVVTTGSTMMELFVTEPARYMNERGVEITLVCGMDEAFQKRNSFAKCVPIKMKRGMDFWGMARTIRLLVKLFREQKYDIVQYSSPNAALCAALAGKITGIKTRLYCQWGIRYVGFKGMKRKIFKGLEKLTCQLSTYVEPDSFGNLEFGIKEKLYSEQKAGVVWNGSASGINLEKFDFEQKEPWKSEIRAKLNILPDDFVYGFIGRITRDKGVEELLLAFQKVQTQFSKCKLLLVGEQDEFQTLNKELLDWALDNENVILPGRVSNAQKYLAAMDAFVLPSYREGFGTVVIEAAAMAVPIIISNIPGPTDVIKNNKNGLVVATKSVKELYEAMIKLKNNPDLCQRIGVDALHMVQEEFEQTEMFRKIFEDRKRLAGIEK